MSFFLLVIWLIASNFNENKRAGYVCLCLSFLPLTAGFFRFWVVHEKFGKMVLMVAYMCRDVG
jgi:hypothetical protein